MAQFTPLRYPGGKGKLAHFVKRLFEYNNLNDGTYVEPYAGGAAVALSLLLEGYAWKIVINDLDPFVHAFWWAALNETDVLLRKIYDTPVNMGTWYAQKNIIANAADFSVTDIGFATFFLNRTNRSGILEAGVIGGKNQTGNYLIDARYNKPELLKRFELIALYKSRIQLYNIDAIELISTIIPRIEGKCLVYFDPPYFNKGKLLYRNCYTPEDHAVIARAIRRLIIPWLVTYDNVPEICKLYVGEKHAPFDISYSAHMDRERGQEVMFYKNLLLPCAPYTRKEALKISRKIAN
jgi:DNA adenine methylase